MASFYLRAVCQNRNLWGVEDFQEITIRHSKYAASRFAQEAAPALTRFANSSPQGFVHGIKAARQQIVARTDEDRDDFLRKRGFSKAESGKIIEKVLMEGAARPRASLTLCRGSLGSRGTRPSRMPALIWKGGPRSSSTGSADVWGRAGGFAVLCPLHPIPPFSIPANAVTPAPSCRRAVGSLNT